ncbi:MAG: sensor histidine kinase [Lewinellaceae bacterium]|nr:sensor histidine kinase [Lewinella sp.]MCB9278248.1 sensor histidine kinase [Lewinellaceae bacterium]
MSRKQRIIFHIGYWFFVLFYSDFLQIIGNRQYEFSWKNWVSLFGLTSVMFMVGGAYAILWVINRYFDSKQYRRLAAGIFGVMLCYVLLRYFIEENVTRWIWGVHNYYYTESFTWLYYTTDSLYNSVRFLFHAAFLKMVTDFFKNEKIKNELKSEKTEAELAFLKSQLNPHFLFNTLNNIYVLAYQRAESAPEAVLKLSEIMRYMLYESNEHTVSLQEEVKYLKNLIALQEMRHKGGACIRADFKGQFDGKRIAPLLLSPFVENAFKHGEAGDPEHPLAIRFLESGGNLHFSVNNRKSKRNKDQIGGVGMANVRRRLELLYPDRYSLDIREDDHEYACELNLILA